MRKTYFMLGIVLTVIISSTLFSQSPGYFGTSLHKTREGKRTWYKKENEGFENITNIPIDNLKCQKCHPGTKADGTPVNPATYTPDCYDCHNFMQGTKVPDEICLRCHGRQRNERNIYSTQDVHYAKGFTCMRCHTQKDVHGDGNSYASLLDPNGIDIKCDSPGCHPNISSSPAHTLHPNVHCTACHSKTVIKCYNCHFESEVQSGVKRPYGVMRDFILLVRRMPEGKIYTGTIMTLSYQGKTFVTVAPYTSHVTLPVDSTRKCSECHNNSNVRTYYQTGELYIVKWDTTQKRLTNMKGVIPLPPNWRNAYKFDFVDYTGRVDTSWTDPTKWIFLKSGADLTQQLSRYVEPLTSDQMMKLLMPVSVKDNKSLVPSNFALLQNYPNPFNPKTTIEFHLPKETNVTLKVYNSAGVEVRTLISNVKYSAGIHKVNFDASNLPSGVYIYKLTTPEFSDMKKMVLLK